MANQTDVGGRRALTVPQFSWDHPVPLGVRLGNLVISSIIPAHDPATWTSPSDVKRQVEFLFQHMKDLIEDAGGTIDDIARVTFLVRNKVEHRPLIDEAWNAMFGAGGVQPARLVIEIPPQGGSAVQCEFIGMLGSKL